jgi:hypothetical protein
VDAPRGVSLAPLVAAPAERAPAPLAEPSFELVKPRKRRGALWLVLGAAAAIGVFAARPWLARQVAAATGMWPETATDAVEPAPTTPLITTSATVSPATTATDNADATPSATSLPVGIASTPAVPSTKEPGRSRAPAEAHVVIHDTVDPSLRELAHPKELPPAAAPAPTPPPAAPPPAPPTPPASPPPAAKPKDVPVSDADRYGI